MMPDNDLDLDAAIELLEEQDGDAATKMSSYGRHLISSLRAEQEKARDLSARHAEYMAAENDRAVVDAAREAGFSAEQLASLQQLNPNLDAAAVATYAEVLAVKPVSGEPAKVEGDTSAPAPSDQLGTREYEPFVPAPGSSLPPKPVTSADIKAALDRGDDAFLRQTVARAIRDPQAIALDHEADIG